MNRIERQPEPWDYSDDYIRRVLGELEEAKSQEKRGIASGFNWGALWGAVLGTSVSLLCWYGIIYSVLYAYHLISK